MGIYVRRSEHGIKRHAVPPGGITTPSSFYRCW